MFLKDAMINYYQYHEDLFVLLKLTSIKTVCVGLVSANTSQFSTTVPRGKFNQCRNKAKEVE